LARPKATAKSRVATGPKAESQKAHKAARRRVLAPKAKPTSPPRARSAQPPLPIDHKDEDPRHIAGAMPNEAAAVEASGVETGAAQPSPREAAAVTVDVPVTVAAPNSQPTLTETALPGPALVRPPVETTPQPPVEATGNGPPH
jgi:hypothetical protein